MPWPSILPARGVRHLRVAVITHLILTAITVAMVVYLLLTAPIKHSFDW